MSGPVPRASLAQLRRIVMAAEKACRLPKGSLVGATRRRPVVRIRHAAMLACRDLTSASLPQIGLAFGRDHTTVLYGIRRSREWPEAAALVALVARSLPGALQEPQS